MPPEKPDVDERRRGRTLIMPPENPPLADEALARQAQAGSMSGFEELVARYGARIFRFVENSCRDHGVAQELTQDTFVSAWRNLRHFDPGRPFVTWLFAIARRKCIDRSRTARRDTTNGLPELADVNDPSAALEQHEAVRDIWNRARHVLPLLQFQALWLRYAEEMSVTDIARVLRRTRVHVKVLLFRARNSLAAELAGHVEPAPTAAKPAVHAPPLEGLKRRASAKAIG